MILRMHGREIERAVADPLPWFDNEGRAELERPLIVVWSTEVDASDRPTGWYRASHPQIDLWDTWSLDVWREGWKYVDKFSEREAKQLIRLQHANDWELFELLLDKVSDQYFTRGMARNFMNGYAVDVAKTLKVKAPELDREEIAPATDNRTRRTRRPLP